jgi:hypothetical protein
VKLEEVNVLYCAVWVSVHFQQWHGQTASLRASQSIVRFENQEQRVLGAKLAVTASPHQTVVDY